jgi:hypothetical protein
MIISEDIEQQFKQLRKDTGASVHTVTVFSPDIVLALVVPRGAKETADPDVDLVGEDYDWGEVTRPTLVLFQAQKDKGPRLIIVPSGDAA